MTFELIFSNDHLGGRLPETENNRKCPIPGLKSGRGRLKNLRSGRLRESF